MTLGIPNVFGYEVPVYLTLLLLSDLIQSWNFEASNDGKVWELLRKHENDTNLKLRAGSTATWEVEYNNRNNNEHKHQSR